MTDFEIIAEGKRVFETEISALTLVQNALDEKFVEIVKLMCNCKGKVVITGMGKPGHIAKKIAATMSSLGVSTFFVHPAEAQHGDLGMISSDDIVIAISYSGESEEVVRIIQNIKVIGAKLIAVSGNSSSLLVTNSDYSFVFPKFVEACSMNIAPTSSTTAALVFGDALAVCASQVLGFKENNYALFHPSGALGKKLLLTASDLMHKASANSVVTASASVEEAIVEMSKKALGIVNIVENDILIGVFTDGDLRRALCSKVDIYNCLISDLMVTNPKTISPNVLAIEALKIMNEKNISALPVVEDGKLLGTIRVNDITKSGIVL